VTTTGPTRSGWVGRLFFGPWWLVYAGVVAPTERHRHHAVQIVLAPGASVVDDTGQRPSPTVIAPDLPHALAGGGTGTVVFIDPEATTTPRLLADPTSLATLGLTNELPATMTDAEELIGSLTHTGDETRPGHHPAIAAVLGMLPDGPDAPLAALASQAGISASRLTHLFTQDLGIPLRAYRRWVRFMLAADALQNGATLTQAAHRAGFADVAHLHRTFRDQFGLRPGRLLRAVEWVTT
jgi:AraC-like DNA-binding protein